MKEEALKKEVQENLSKHEMELDLQRKKDVISETEKLLRFSTDRYKEIHRGMMLSKVLKERDMALKLKEDKVILEKERIKKEVSNRKVTFV